MSRALVLLTALAVLIAAAAPASAAAPPEDLTLRLADVGPGYLIPDESCVPTHLRSDGTSRVVNRIARLRHRGCEIGLWRLWVAPGAPAGPRQVSSRALVFDDAEGPQLALTRPRVVVSFMSEPTREELEVVEPAPAIGDEAVLLRAPEERFRRRSWWTAIVLWRSGGVLAMVQTISADADAGIQAALRLATAQQARIAAPTPLGADDNDAAEVGLDTPGFGLPVYWLGHDLAASGRLPDLTLTFSLSSRLLGREAMGMTYGRDGGVSVALLHPRTLHQPSVRREVRRIARDRCTRRERVPLPQGRATIWTSRGRRCDPRPDDTFAVARLPGVVAVLGVGVEHGPLTRYATRAGMLRLLRTLRPRAPLSEAPAPPAAP